MRGGAIVRIWYGQLFLFATAQISYHVSYELYSEKTNLQGVLTMSDTNSTTASKKIV